MSEIAAIIKLHGIEARLIETEIDDDLAHRWECDDKHVEHLLNSVSKDPGWLPYQPKGDRIARYVADHLHAKIEFLLGYGDYNGPAPPYIY